MPLSCYFLLFVPGTILPGVPDTRPNEPETRANARQDSTHTPVARLPRRSTLYTDKPEVVHSILDCGIPIRGEYENGGVLKISVYVK